MIVTRRSVLAGFTAAAACGGHSPAGELAFARPPRAYRMAGRTIAFRWDDDDQRAAVTEIMKRGAWRFQWLSRRADDLRAVALHLPTGFAYLTLPDEVATPPGHEVYFVRCLLSEGFDLTHGYAERERIGRAAAFLAAEMAATDEAVYVPKDWWWLGDVDYPENEPRPTHPLIDRATAEGFFLNV